MREIRALTALRGLAAMAVVLQHFSATAQLHAARSIPSLAPHGYMAVDFFFVLSGFIMSYTYLDRFTSGRPGAYAEFLARRIARVVPLNIAVLLLIVAAGGLSLRLLGRDIVNPTTNIWFDLPVNILMLQGLIGGTNMNGPSWSISVEFVAYLCFPALIALAFSRHAAVRVLLAVAALAAVFGVFLFGRNIASETIVAGPALLRCFSEFSLGMLAFGIFRSGRFAWIGSDEAVMLLCGAAIFSLIMRTDLPAALLFAPIVVACARNTGYAARIFGSPVPYFLGVVSYSLYMIHNILRPPLLLALRTLHPERLDTLPALAFALAGSLAVIPIAWLAYVAVERPGRRWGRGLLSAK